MKQKTTQDNLSDVLELDEEELLSVAGGRGNALSDTTQVQLALINSNQVSSADTQTHRNKAGLKSSVSNVQFRGQ